MKVGPQIDENYTTNDIYNLLLAYYMKVSGTYYLYHNISKN